MKLEDAKNIAIELNGLIAWHFSHISLCGSIRRGKAEVHDIDLVGIVRTDYKFGEPTLSQSIRKLDPNGEKEAKEMDKQGASRFLDGKDIKRFKYKEITIDVYIAEPEEYETLCLIRTGSTEHNIRLTTLAIGKGMKLFASGKGLWKVDNDKNQLELVSNTEDGILKTLLGHYVEPKDRG